MGSVRPRVVVIGGGVGGMTVAHELAERGFSVRVIERRDVPGGKARSTEVFGSATGGRKPLPGEHGFRFFPGFYRHLPDTLGRIPDGNGKTVRDHLVRVATMTFAFQDRLPFVLPARFPRTWREVGHVLGFFEGVGQMGITVDDLVFTWWKLWQIVTTCHQRRVVELEQKSWWDYMEADSRTEEFRRLLVVGLTRNLVASRAEAANARTVGQVGIQLIRDLLTPGAGADYILDGPTNDVWIEPWLRRLKELDVSYENGLELTRVNLDATGRRVASVVVRPRLVDVERGPPEVPVTAGLSPEVVEADYFVLAVPVEVTATLLRDQPELLAAAPAFAGVPELAQEVEWMNGIQFYLTERVDIADGHLNHVDSAWALTTISQTQFWPNHPASGFGDGRVKTVISVDISAWDVPGKDGKCAKDCDFRALADECFRQLMVSLNHDGKTVLTPSMLHPTHPFNVDDDIAERRGKHAALGRELLTNAEPLLVNLEDSWKLRPGVDCEISNLFVASDYVRTHTNLATMEAASEAGRAAANAILKAAKSSEKPATLFPLREPFRFLRRRDRARLRRGEPHENPALLDLGVKLALVVMASGLRVLAWLAALPRPLYPIMALIGGAMWLFGRFFEQAWGLAFRFGCGVIAHGSAPLPPACALPVVPEPSGPGRAAFWYAAYMLLFGLSMAVMPRRVLTRLGFPAEPGPWIPILGATPLVMATFYATAAIFDVREFFWLSVLGRVLVFLYVVWLTFGRKLGSTLLLLMALPDFGSALWSAALLVNAPASAVLLCFGIGNLALAVTFGLFPAGLLKMMGFPEQPSAWVPMAAILMWFWGTYEVLAVLLGLAPLYPASAVARVLFGGICLLAPLVYRLRAAPFVQGFRLWFVGAAYLWSAHFLWARLG